MKDQENVNPKQDLKPTFIKKNIQNPISNFKERTLDLKKEFIQELQGFDKGLVPFFASFFINLIFISFFFLLLTEIEQAKHLILSQLPFSDPIFATFLIILYSVLTVYIYRKKLAEYIIKQEGSLVELQKGSGLTWTANILLFAPIVIWTIFLIYYMLFHDVEENQWNKISSLFMGITGFLLLVLINKEFAYPRLIPKGSKTEKDKIISEIILEVANNQIPRLNGYLKVYSWFLFGILVLNVIMYETFNTFKHIQQIKSNLTEIGLQSWILSLLTVILYSIYFYLRIEHYKKARQAQSGSGKAHKVAINWSRFVLVLLIIPLLISGTLRPLEILILFFCTMRFLIYFMSANFANILGAIPKIRSVKPKSLIKGDVIVGNFAFSFLTVLLFISLPDFMSENDDEKYRIESEFRNVEDQLDSIGIGVLFEKWIGTFKDTTILKDSTLSSQQNLYIISGQGGGSRAGATIYGVLSSLPDSIQNDIFAITTISGSSNGTGFYLTVKKHAGIDPKIDHINYLYEYDYISESLFKMLFTDWVPFLRKCKTSRNISLMRQEKERITQLIKDSAVAMNDTPLYIDNKWSNLYFEDSISTSLQFPLFFPVSYNITRGFRGVMSPVYFDKTEINPTFPLYCQTNNGYCFSDISIHQSILTSQTFPLINATKNIRGERFIDGGTYDNLSFKTAEEIYSAITPIRDEKYPGLNIYVISIENGKLTCDPSPPNSVDCSSCLTGYDKPKDEKNVKNEFHATFTGASKSIFQSVPCENYFNLRRKMKESKYNDAIFRVHPYSYTVINPDNEKEKKDEIITMSRVLSKNDIKRMQGRIKKATKELNLQIEIHRLLSKE